MLSETKLNKRHTISLDGYEIIRNDRETNKGGGTAICYSNQITCEYIPTPESIKSFECCIAKVKLSNNENIIFASIYKPPTAIINGKTTLIKIDPKELHEIFKLEKNAKVMIGGDFNAQHGSWNSKNECTNGKIIAEWLQSYAEYHNISVYAAELPTCNRSLEGSHIDFGFISSTIEITNCLSKTSIQSEPFSDHAALIMKLSIEPRRTQITTVKNYKKANWNRIQQYIKNKIDDLAIPTERNIPTLEIEHIVEYLTGIYNEAIDKYVPELKIRPDEVKLSNQTEKLLHQKKKHSFGKNFGTKTEPNILKLTLT